MNQFSCWEAESVAQWRHFEFFICIVLNFYVVEDAVAKEGIMVFNDLFRDLRDEDEAFKEAIKDSFNLILFKIKTETLIHLWIMMQRNMIQEVNIYLAPKHGLEDFLMFW